MSTIDVPAGVVMSYNGYTFPSNAKTVIEGDFVLDEARWTVMATEWHIDVRWWVTDANGTDDDISAIRQILSKAGGLLKLTNKGFGDLTINQTVYDINWGPTPERMRVEFVGGAQATRLNWRCKFTIPECSVSGLNGLLAYNFEREYEVDESRLGTVTLRGHFIIPLTRLGANNRVVRQSAGQFRRLINYPMMPGYERIREVYSESKDKRRLDFTIVDRQLNANELPFGCSAATGEHSAATNLKSLGDGNIGGDIPWLGNVNANYTLLPNVPKATAANHFFAFTETIAKSAAARGRQILLHNVKYNEGLYQRNREVSFSTEYLVLCPLSDLVLSTGMWKPLPNTDSKLYLPFLKQVGLTDLGDYRQTGLEDYPGVVIDLCQGADIRPYTPSTQPEPKSVFGAPPLPTDNRLTNTKSNWILWDCRINVKTNENNVAHLKLRNPTEPLRQPVSPIASGKSFSGGGKLVNQQSQKVSPLTFQKRADSHHTVCVYGKAARIGQPIGIPSVTTIGGQVPVKKMQVGDQHIVGQANGMPICFTWWYLEYWVDSIPNNLKVPTAPANVRDSVGLNL